jgi:hypothetical protein
MTTETSETIWAAVPAPLRRWVGSLFLGAALGSGGTVAVNRAWPSDYSPSITAAVEKAITPIVWRIDRIELKLSETDKLLGERGAAIGANSARLANLESRLSLDVAAIRESIGRLEEWVMDLKSAGVKP